MARITNSQVSEVVVKSYLRRITTGKLDKGIDKNPGVLIIGWTGTGKSSGVYQAAQKIAEMFGKKLFIYGKDKIEVDVDELAYKYQQMYDKIKKITGAIVKNGKLPRIDEEILSSIVKDTFMDLTIDEIFEMLDAVSIKKAKPPVEYFKLVEERKRLLEKLLNDTATDEERLRLEEVEDLLKNYKNNPSNGIFVFVDFDLNQVETVDMTGVIVKTSVGFRYLPPLWALLLKRHGGILFLDEFTNVESNEKRSIAYRIVYSKKIGEIFLDRRTLIVAAGNTTADSSIASELPWPLTDRFAIFRVDSIDKDGVIRHFIKNFGYSKAALKVIAFLASNSVTVLFNLPKGDTKETLETFETPRSWEFIIRDLMALNGDIEPESPEAKMLLSLYGLKPGELVENAENNMKIAEIVTSIAEEYVSPSVAQMLGTQWVEKVISPEELIKDPGLFIKTYGNTKRALSMGALQTVFMYGQYLTTKLAEEIKNVEGGKTNRYARKKMEKIRNEILPKYITPIKVMGKVNMEYVTFLLGLVSATAEKQNLMHYILMGIMREKELYETIRNAVNKIAFSL